MQAICYVTPWVVLDGCRLKLAIFPTLEAILTIERLNEHGAQVLIYKESGPAVSLLKELALHTPEALIEVVRGGGKGPEAFLLEEIK